MSGTILGAEDRILLHKQYLIDSLRNKPTFLWSVTSVLSDGAIPGTTEATHRAQSQSTEGPGQPRFPRALSGAVQSLDSLHNNCGGGEEESDAKMGHGVLKSLNSF